MGPTPDLPPQTIVREYRGTESVARGLAAIDAERLAEQGWRVESEELEDVTKEPGCAVTLFDFALDILGHGGRGDEKKCVLRVTYALGKPSDPELPVE